MRGMFHLGLIAMLALTLAPLAMAADSTATASSLVLPLSLIAIGVFLLIVEGAVLPGFGVAGIAGILVLAAGLFIGARDVSVDLLNISEGGIAAIGMGLVGAVVGCTVISVGMIKALPRMPGARRLINADGLVNVETESAADMREKVGRSGVARTDLRPAGKVRIDDKDYDVTTNEGWINVGEQVIVESAQEGYLVVKRVV